MHPLNQLVQKGRTESAMVTPERNQLLVVAKLFHSITLGWICVNNLVISTTVCHMKEVISRMLHISTRLQNHFLKSLAPVG